MIWWFYRRWGQRKPLKRLRSGEGIEAFEFGFRSAGFGICSTRLGFPSEKFGFPSSRWRRRPSSPRSFGATVTDREPVDPWEPCALLDAAGPSIHPERGKIETEDRLLLDPFVAVLLSDR